jgi:membrane protein
VTFFKNRPWDDVVDVLKSKKTAAIFGVAQSLIAARSSLPPLLKRFVNESLRRLGAWGIFGKVEGVDLHLLQAKIILRNLHLRWTTHPPVVHPLLFKGNLFIPSAVIVLSWKELLRGRVSADVVIHDPRLTLEWPPASKAARKKIPHRRAADPTWRRFLQELIPIRIDHALVRGGEARFENLPGQDGADFSMRHLQIVARNLTNDTDHWARTQETSLEAEADALSGGSLQLRARGFPLSTTPTFDADLALRQVNLRDASFLFREWLGMRVDSGVLDLFAEAAAAQGAFKGYVKPVIDQMHVEKAKKGIGEWLKTMAVKIAAFALRTGQEERIATRVEFSGEFSELRVGYGAAVTNLFKNAFLETFKPRLEHSIFFSKEGRTAERTEIVIPAEKPTRWSNFKSLVKESVDRWNNDNAMRLSAALSYYTAFSLAPLMIFTIAMAALAFGHSAAQGRIVEELAGLIGQQGAEAIRTMLQGNAQKTTTGVIATMIGFATMLVGASSVMVELKEALNKIWRVKEAGGVRAAIRQKVFSFLMVVVIGFLLLSSALVSGLFTVAGQYWEGILPYSKHVMQTANAVLSFGIVASLFAVLFKMLPDIDIAWRDVWLGSALTSVLFNIGKFLIALYLGKAGITSSYGAAGSVLVILTGVYYSSMIFYFGAEFTKSYADRRGSRASALTP